MQPPWRASILAAFVAGLPVLLAFFVWHWLTIAPVWTVLFEGLVGVALAALGTAWAWRLSRGAGRFAGPWGGLAFGAIFAGAVLLDRLLGLAFGPWPDPTSFAEALPILSFVLIPVALVALAGWRIEGGWRGATAYTLASVVLLVYLGGSVVQRGGVGLAVGLFWILFLGYLAAGVLLAWLEPRLARRDRNGAR